MAFTIGSPHFARDMMRSLLRKGAYKGGNEFCYTVSDL